jgi:hypothetical protein
MTTMNSNQGSIAVAKTRRKDGNSQQAGWSSREWDVWNHALTTTARRPLRHAWVCVYVKDSSSQPEGR